MRKTVMLMFLACSLFLSGCSKDETQYLSEVLVGKWTLEMYVPATKTVKIGNEPIDVTVSFFENNRFSLSQRIGQAYMVSFDGTWSLDGTTLSGQYSDKKPWGESYEITFRDNDNTLEMKTLKAKEVYVYQRMIE